MDPYELAVLISHFKDLSVVPRAPLPVSVVFDILTLINVNTMGALYFEPAPYREQIVLLESPLVIIRIEKAARALLGLAGYVFMSCDSSIIFEACWVFEDC